MKQNNFLKLSTLLVSLWALSEAKSVTYGKTGQLRSDSQSEEQYDYTYGDLNYQLDTPVKSDGRPSQHRVKYAEQSIATMPHEVIYGDVFNYDYTYGDPGVDHGDWPDSDEADDDEDADEEDHVVTSDGEDDDEDDEDDEEDVDDLITDKVIKPIVTSVLDWVFRNWRDIQSVKETYIEAKERVKASWRKVKHSLTTIRKILREVLTKFGAEAEQGLKYFLVRFDNATHEISERGLEAIDKMEKLLKDGNKMVASFFRLVGTKVQEISRTYAEYPLFTADMKLSEYFTFADVGDGASGKIQMPDIFEDPEVLGKLELLVEANILEREDVEELLTAAAQQAQRATGKSYPQKITLVKTDEELPR